ncbi:MAG TPA: TonB-dependent receptor [Puia sp.]|nr:TonB-dependent receptor [Puia sp.]
MKHFCIVLALFSSCFFVQAQQSDHPDQQPGPPKEKGRITGRIVDSVSHSAIEYATVAVYAQNNTRPVNGATTNEKGVFSLSGLTPGNYTLSIDFIGYQTRSVGPLAYPGKTPVISLGDLLLSKKTDALQSVTVTAPRGLVENKIDKMVYNAEKDITSQGGVATDILKKVPMVSVDVDGNVELQGNSNILFLINGKPSSIFGNNLADALQTIPASQIKSIEVITSPGARYDAEGTGGIINIILKENKIRGINGNISLTGGSRLENGSLNLNARKGSFGMNAFFSGNAQREATTINSSDRSSEDTAGGTKSSLLQQGSSAFYRNGYESGLGFDWNISHRDNLSGSLGYDNFGNNNKGAYQQEQAQYAAPSGNMLSDLYSLVHSSSHFRGQSLDWNLSYKRTFPQEDRELNIQYEGSNGKNNSFYSQEQGRPSGDSIFTGSYSNNAGKDHEMNIRLDYTQPLSEKVRLETGGRMQVRHITSVSDVYSLQPASTYDYDSSQSNSLTYTRHNYAGYGSLTFPLGAWLEVKGGLRYERTETDAVFSKAASAPIPGYNTLTPSLILSHSFAGEQSLKISYAKRIQRPNYRNLNPFVNAADPKNISTGNPYLAPEVAHNIDLTYSKSFEKGSALNIVLFYHRSEHDIQPYVIYYPSYQIGDSTYTNVSVTRPVNIGAENNFGLNIYGSVPLTAKLNVRGNLSFFDRYITTGTLAGNSITSFNYRMNMNATYQLSNSFVLEFFGNFNSPRNEIQGKYPSFTSYNFAFRKQIWNKKGSIAFTTTNPFSKYLGQETAVTGSNFTLNSSRRIPFRSFGINFTWKFGKLEFRKDKEENKETPGPAETKDNNNG